jgi:hypothetical protein
MATQIQRIVSFDIGIRNLAWCCMRRDCSAESNLYTVEGWENEDLLAETSGSATKITCIKCSAKATHSTGTLFFCGRHSSSEKPVLRDLSGALVKKIPSQAVLKVLFAQKAIVPMPKTREATLQKLAEFYTLPLEQKKKKKAVDTELSVLHDAIRAMVLKHKTLFQTATAIHLENQPVLKNPTMKTVQILLYATLRDLLGPSPPAIRLIHAGVKVKGKTSGDKGYKERKQGSEEKVAELFRGGKIQDKEHWQAHLAKHSKQNDLTDAFCMCVDALSS